MIRLRRLNESGLTAFSTALDRLDAFGEGTVPPIDPFDPALSTPHPIPLQIDEAKRFSNRFECAGYLFSVLGTGQIENVEQDFALWNWLSVIFFDQLCPADGRGHRKLRQRARYVPSPDYNTAYRHLLLG